MGDLGSIQVVSYQRLKMVLDTALLNTQQYKVRIKGKVGQSSERSSAFPTSGEVAMEKEPSGRPRQRSPIYLYIYIYIYIYYIYIYIYIF